MLSGCRSLAKPIAGAITVAKPVKTADLIKFLLGDDSFI